MPLTLRPTRLYRPAVYAHLKDWEVWEDGKEIGRIMEGREGATKSEQAWFWAITSLEYGMRARARVTTEGHARTLDEAKADFRRNWKRMKAWKPERS
jgi:hypothetical protein